MSSEIAYEDFIEIFDFPPTQEQEEVIRSTAPTILVLAGAGAGKTATMSQRIAWHIAAKNVTPQEVLGLTFTKKAAGELSERVDSYVRKVQRKFPEQQAGFRVTSSDYSDAAVGGESVSDLEYSLEQASFAHKEFERPTISTYNSFASEIAMSYAMLIGEDPRARLITDGERWQIMQSIVANWGADQNNLGDFDLAESSIVDTALSMAAAIIDNKCSLDEVRSFFLNESQAIEDIDGGMRLVKMPFKGTEATEGFTQLKKAIKPLQQRAAIVDVVEAYFDYKKANSLIEYADQVEWATRILKKVPQIGEELRAKYRLILLDEYQDTSINQAEFIAAAFLGAESVCAVGDPNQAIYGWRGASANALADFREKFAVSGENTLSLSVAFRNSRSILHAANVITSDFDDRHSSEQIDDLDDAEFERPWRKIPAVPPVSSSLKLQQLQPSPVAKDGSVIHVHRHLREDSYRSIAQQIAEIFNCNAQGETSSLRAKSNGLSAAILLRKHKFVPDVIAALEEHGLNYEVIGGEQIISLPEIRLLRAILTLISTPARNDALMVVLNYYAIGARDLRILSDFAYKLRKEQEMNLLGNDRHGQYPRALQLNLIEAISYLESADQLAEFGMSQAGARRIMEVAATLKDIRSYINLHLPELVLKVIDALNLYTLVEARYRGAKRLKSAFTQFVDLASDFANNNPQLGIGDFCRWIDAVENKERGGSEESDQDIPVFELHKEVVPQANVVQILTVHAAKGLEWDIVAVPELVSGEFSNTVERPKSWHSQTKLFPYPLRIDRKYLPIFSAQDMLKDSPYEAMIKESGNSAYFRKGITACIFHDYYNRMLPEYESDETRRLAYVAFTRPKSYLILGSYDFKDLEKVKQAYDANIERASEEQSLEKTSVTPSVYLDDMYRAQARTGQIIFTPKAQLDPGIYEQSFDTVEEFLSWAQPLVPADDGSSMSSQNNDEIMWPRDVDRRLDSQPAIDQTANINMTALARSLDETEKVIELLIAEKEAENSAAGFDSEHLTASGIVSLLNDPREFLMDQIRPIPRKPLRAARIGTDVHSKIAQYFGAPSTLDIDSVAYPGEMPIDDDVLADEPRIKELLGRFENSRFAQLPQLAIEQAVEISLLSTPIRCVIDAVFDTSQVDGQKPITIVDWKTGRRPSAKDISSRQFQLELYRLAWSHAYNVPLDSIAACFYYLGEDDQKLRELHAQNLDRERIEEVIAQKIKEGEQLI
ncbi:ATP-dependent helicase [Arcanobacterium bovis]|uniref:DNA 3'-5' helicase n=1 Tax=Arcanobacterium bovis TaxID=2529275 RepID=A0A4Q9V1W8_9ACTO|nr:UvrD-helicase domain-containing protein [Arcanobacterium bovis]TBW22121.1 ATP-dependent helicase [Arcanobacterium bovis]